MNDLAKFDQIKIASSDQTTPFDLLRFEYIVCKVKTMNCLDLEMHTSQLANVKMKLKILKNSLFSHFLSQKQ